MGIHLYQYYPTQPVLEAAVKTMITSNKELSKKEDIMQEFITTSVLKLRAPLKLFIQLPLY